MSNNFLVSDSYVVGSIFIKSITKTECTNESKIRLFNELREIVDEIEQKRALAIIDCYGKKAIKNDFTIKIEELDEEITSWYIKDFDTVEDLYSISSLKHIVAIYDSGL